MLARLLPRCAVISITGDSYRLRAHRATNQQRTTTITPTRSGEFRRSASAAVVFVVGGDVADAVAPGGSGCIPALGKAYPMRYTLL